jgi:hypothetical protein
MERSLRDWEVLVVEDSQVNRSRRSEKIDFIANKGKLTSEVSDMFADLKLLLRRSLVRVCVVGDSVE